MSYPLPNASTDLSGQTALVTGASSGLGLRFAKVLASRGAKVALAARRLDRLEALAAEIRADGGQAVAIAMDATDADQLIAAVAKAEAELGLVTILVNNAGIPDAQRAHKMSTELIDRVLDINVRAPFILSCEVARRLLDAKQPGRIVNIASSAAYDYAGGGAALYSVSKAAVVRMTETLALQHQCERHRARRLRVRNDGGHAGAGGGYRPALPAQAHREPGAAGLDAAVPGLARLGRRHRHVDPGG
jgi:NAD(P)-dependent dehydrogenase (short-subunit alcohol dehydrogenase family)